MLFVVVAAKEVYNNIEEKDSVNDIVEDVPLGVLRVIDKCNFEGNNHSSITRIGRKKSQLHLKYNHQ